MAVNSMASTVRKLLDIDQYGWCDVTIGNETFPCSYVMNPVLEIADMIESWLDGTERDYWSFDAEGEMYDVELVDGKMRVVDTGCSEPVTPTAELFEQDRWLRIRDLNENVIETIKVDDEFMHDIADRLISDFGDDINGWLMWEYVNIDDDEEAQKELDEYKQMYYEAFAPVVDGFAAKGEPVDNAVDVIYRLAMTSLDDLKKWADEKATESKEAWEHAAREYKAAHHDLYREG